VCISRTAVLPARRGAGVGRRLVAAAVAAAAPVAGAVYVAAGRSERGFYTLLGAVPLGPETTPAASSSSSSSSAAAARAETDVVDAFAFLAAQSVDGGAAAGGGLPAAPLRRLPADPPLPPEPVRVMVLPPAAVAAAVATGTPTPPPDGVPPSLGHTAVAVSSLDASLGWYGALGFVAVDTYRVDGARAALVDGLGTRLALVEAPRRWGGGRPPGGGRRGGARTGLHGLVLDVTRGCPSLELLLADVRAKLGGGLTVVAAPAERVVGRHLVSAAAVVDPDGAELGLWRLQAVVPAALRSRGDW